MDIGGMTTRREEAGEEGGAGPEGLFLFSVMISGSQQGKRGEQCCCFLSYRIRHTVLIEDQRGESEIYINILKIARKATDFRPL